MASAWKWRCVEGHSDKHVRRPLFDVLKDCSEKALSSCPDCGSNCRLIIEFDFGLDATENECEVLDCFLPAKMEEWHDSDDNLVVFHPFLVVLRRTGRDLAVWLPYWHLVHTGTGIEKKYGQWAPFMDMRLFESLTKQARACGYRL